MMVAVAMAVEPRRSLCTSGLSKRLAARNRTWLKMFDDAKLTARQIAKAVSQPLRTVQRGLKWARANPERSEEHDDAKLTDSTLKYAEKMYGNLDNPAVRDWLASLRRRN